MLYNDLIGDLFSPFFCTLRTINNCRRRRNQDVYAHDVFYRDEENNKRGKNIVL